jgi:hypothetical protein
MSAIQTERQEPIAVGQVILTLPVGVDPKPYIRQILWIEMGTIAHPKVRERLEVGLNEAETDEDFSSLMESFHLCRSEANAAVLFDSLDNDSATMVYGSVDELRREFGLAAEAC